jgi:hypothetical protein
MEKITKPTFWNEEGASLTSENGKIVFVTPIQSGYIPENWFVVLYDDDGSIATVKQSGTIPKNLSWLTSDRKKVNRDISNARSAVLTQFYMDDHDQETIADKNNTVENVPSLIKTPTQSKYITLVVVLIMIFMIILSVCVTFHLFR